MTARRTIELYGRQAHGCLAWSRNGFYEARKGEIRGNGGRCASRRTPKRNTVRVMSALPGLKMVDGNPDLFGESGKCCVSRHKPLRRRYGRPDAPRSVPSRKLPV